MSNLLKRASIIDSDERIIDYNAIIQEKLESLRVSAETEKINADRFMAGITAQAVEQLVDEAGNPVEAVSEDASIPNGEFGGRILAAQSIVPQEEIDAARAEAEQIINDANVQAQQMIDSANEEAQQIMLQAQHQGYQEGSSQAQLELAKSQAVLENEYAKKAETLESEYAQRKAQLEPQLVEVLMDVFAEVTHAIADDNKEIVLGLINNVLHSVEMTSDFVIRVSPSDYQFVIDNQGKIYCAMTKDVSMDIIEDASLEKNQCRIVADSGVYDCSLDIQLGNLIKDIKLLSSISG